MGTYEYLKLDKNGKKIFKKTLPVSAERYLFVDTLNAYWSVSIKI